MSTALACTRPGRIDVVAALATALVGTLAAIATVLGGCVPTHALPPAPVRVASAVATPQTPSPTRSAPQRPASPPPVLR